MRWLKYSSRNFFATALLVSALVSCVTSKVDTLGPEEMHDLLNRNEHVVCMAVESWCDSCKEFSDEFDRIALEFLGKGLQIKFVKVDLQKDREAWNFYGADSLPHFSFVTRGVPVSYKQRVETESLKNWIKKVFKSKPVKLRKKRSIGS